MSKPRYMTADEVERAKRLRASGYSLGHIAIRLGRSKAAVGELVRKGFPMPGKPPRPVPVDFHRYSSAETVHQLKARYRTCAETVMRWLKETNAERPKWFQRPRLNIRRPCPADFVETYERLGWVATMKHYAIGSHRTLVRWKQESGLPTRQMRRRAAEEQQQPNFNWIASYKPAPETARVTELGWRRMRQIAERARSMA